MDNFYKIYLDDCFKLIQSLIIKSTANAELMNEQIASIFGPGYVDYESPHTWRYYLHVCGDYHPLDTPMVITSLDTQTEISFDKQTLKDHPSTIKGYEIGSIYYKELCQKYPGQELLIKGILRPTSMSTVLKAQDNTIITYNEKLIEYQETNIIEELNSYIKHFKVRWDVKAFYYSDELYLTANQAILFMKLVPVLLNIRLKNCKTEKAHTYHIREFLKSHNGLDRFIKHLTLKQLLFLYRNIIYIEANAGKQDTFTWIVDKMLTDRFIPLHEYSVRHTGFLNKENDFLFRKKAVNAINNTPEKILFSHDDIIEKEYYLENNNPNWFEEYEEKLRYTLSYSSSSVLQTKMLESVWLDYTDFTLYTREFVGMNHWFYYTLKGFNKTYVTIDINNYGNYLLDSQTALDYYIYLTNKVLGFNQPRTNIVMSRIITDTIENYEYFNTGINSNLIEIESVYDTLKRNHLDATTFLNQNQLSSRLNDLYLKMKSENDLIASYTHMDANAMAKVLVSRVYKESVHEYDLSNIESKLIDKNLPLEFDTLEDYTFVLNTIFSNCTGINLINFNTVSLTHKNLLEVLKRLSSYTIQLLGYTNRQPIKPVNDLRITPGDLEQKTLHSYYLNVPVLLVEKPRTTIVNEVDQMSLISVHTGRVFVRSRAQIPVTPYLISNGTTRDIIHVKNTLSLNSLEELKPYNYENEDLYSLKDIYS